MKKIIVTFFLLLLLTSCLVIQKNQNDEINDVNKKYTKLKESYKNNDSKIFYYGIWYKIKESITEINMNEFLSSEDNVNKFIENFNKHKTASFYFYNITKADFSFIQKLNLNYNYKKNSTPFDNVISFDFSFDNYKDEYNSIFDDLYKNKTLIKTKDISFYITLFNEKLDFTPYKLLNKIYDFSNNVKWLNTLNIYIANSDNKIYLTKNEFDLIEKINFSKNITEKQFFNWVSLDFYKPKEMTDSELKKYFKNTNISSYSIKGVKFHKLFWNINNLN